MNRVIGKTLSGVVKLYQVSFGTMFGGRSALDLATLLAVSRTLRTTHMAGYLSSFMTYPIDRVNAVWDQRLRDDSRTTSVFDAVAPHQPRTNNEDKRSAAESHCAPSTGSQISGRRGSSSKKR